MGLVRREGRVVGVALRTGVREVADLARVEEVGLGLVQGGARGDACRQVGVRQELGPEGDGVEAPGRDALGDCVKIHNCPTRARDHEDAARHRQASELESVEDCVCHVVVCDAGKLSKAPCPVLASVL